MEPLSLTLLCRTTGDPHEVLDAIQRSVKPDTTTLMAACQRIVQVYQAWQHMLQTTWQSISKGKIRLDSYVPFNSNWDFVLPSTAVIYRIIS
ncbi:MAG: hypothetical protein LLG04_17240 [Parachlamydia sp.]|nr:hypothetical protein [Parachlamydia sp.]